MQSNISNIVIQTCDEKKVCLEPDLKREPSIPYARSILCVTSRIDRRSFDISGFSFVLESKSLIKYIGRLIYQWFLFISLIINTNV